MWNNANKENMKHLRMTCPNVTFSTKNSIWTGLGLNKCLCGKKLEPKQLSDGIEVDLSGVNVIDINSNVSYY